MNIYSCIDHKNVEKILILFNSVLINSDNDDLHFYLLVDKITEFNIPSSINKKLTIKELNISEEWSEILNNFNKHFYVASSWCKSDMNFARFLIFDHFPEVDRFIYLDWDMIVLGDIYKLLPHFNNFDKIIVSSLQNNQTLFTGTFVEIFKISTNKEIISATKDKYKHHPVYNIMRRFDISYEEMFKSQSFNAGFYIVSKNHFDSNFLKNLINNLIDIQSNLKCFNFGTQIIMNYLDKKNFQFIEKSWNHLPQLENNDSVNIIHWNGLEKPWNKKNVPINKIWWKYYEKYKNLK